MTPFLYSSMFLATSLTGLKEKGAGRTLPTSVMKAFMPISGVISLSLLLLRCILLTYSCKFGSSSSSPPEVPSELFPLSTGFSGETSSTGTKPTPGLNINPPTEAEEEGAAGDFLRDLSSGDEEGLFEAEEEEGEGFTVSLLVDCEEVVFVVVFCCCEFD